MWNTQKKQKTHILSEIQLVEEASKGVPHPREPQFWGYKKPPRSETLADPKPQIVHYTTLHPGPQRFAEERLHPVTVHEITLLLQVLDLGDTLLLRAIVHGDTLPRRLPVIAANLMIMLSNPLLNLLWSDHRGKLCSRVLALHCCWVLFFAIPHSCVPFLWTFVLQPHILRSHGLFFHCLHSLVLALPFFGNPCFTLVLFALTFS